MANHQCPLGISLKMKGTILFIILIFSICRLNRIQCQSSNINNDGMFTEASWSPQNIFFQNDGFCLYLIKDKEKIHFGKRIKENETLIIFQSGISFLIININDTI